MKLTHKYFDFIFYPVKQKCFKDRNIIVFRIGSTFLTFTLVMLKGSMSLRFDQLLVT